MTKSNPEEVTKNNENGKDNKDSEGSKNKKNQKNKKNKKNKKIKSGGVPGLLSGSIPFEIHTVDAQLLFSGRIHNGAPNLLKFGGQMTVIWEAAERDDPYADWYLLKVYDAVIRLRNQFAEVIQDYQEKIRLAYGRAQLSLVPFASEKPVVKNLWFRTQYGYLGANIIADFDELMRLALTANRIGVLLDAPIESIRDRWIQKTLSLLRLPFKWQSFEITRFDIINENSLAEKAKAALGQLPSQIIDKKLRAPFAPYIHISTMTEQEVEFKVS